MLKKILKIFAMLLLCLALLLALFRTIHFINYLLIYFHSLIYFPSHAYFEGVAESICFPLSVVIICLALLKNKNKTIFLLGFLAVVIFPLYMILYESDQCALGILPIVVLFIALEKQLLVLKQKWLCCLVCLIFILFMLGDIPYSCECEARFATDTFAEWNWKKMKCERSGGWKEDWDRVSDTQGNVPENSHPELDSGTIKIDSEINSE